jgi:hypothetical protein
MKLIKMAESDLSEVVMLAKQLGYPIKLQEAAERFEKEVLILL